MASVLGLSAVIFESDLVFHDENVNIVARDAKLYVPAILTPSSDGVHFSGVLFFDGEYAAFNDGILYQVSPEIAGKESTHGRLRRLAGVARLTYVILNVLVDSSCVTADGATHDGYYTRFSGTLARFL
jgi:hypothetical protein